MKLVSMPAVLPSAPWRVAVHLMHPDVPAWRITAQQAQHLARRWPQLHCRICADRESFRVALAEAQIALVWSFSQREFDLAPHLQILATPAAGRDYLRVTPPAGVEIVYGRFHGELMAETAVGMLLAMTRGLLPAVTTYRENPWPRRELARAMRPLRGSHLVVLGFGHIGTWVGRLAKPFGVRLTGIRRHPAAAAVPDYFEAQDRIVAAADLDAVMPQADHLVMVLPADPGTDTIMDSRRLALLPAHATLVNLGRGSTIAEGALVDALRTGRLAGACLDVFHTEPLPDNSPLRTCPNLWLLPHASAISPNYMDLFLDDLVLQLQSRRPANQTPG